MALVVFIIIIIIIIPEAAQDVFDGSGGVHRPWLVRLAGGQRGPRRGNKKPGREMIPDRAVAGGQPWPGLCARPQIKILLRFDEDASGQVASRGPKHDVERGIDRSRVAVHPRI